MISDIWSTLLLSWILLRCNYVYFLYHLLIHYFEHPYWHISRITSFILWDFHNIHGNVKWMHYSIFMLIWKINNVEELKLLKEWRFVVVIQRNNFYINMFRNITFSMILFCCCMFLLLQVSLVSLTIAPGMPLVVYIWSDFFNHLIGFCIVSENFVCTFFPLYPS